jgi:hypothetical protein
VQTAQEILRGRAWAELRKKEYREAVEDFTRACEYTDPAKDAAAITDIFRGRSRAYYHLGLIGLALEDAQRAGLRGSGSRIAFMCRINLGRLKRSLGLGRNAGTPQR